MKHLLKCGANLRLNLKVGLLMTRGGVLQWKQLRDDEAAADGRSQATNSMVYSVAKRDLSVRTPTVVQSVRSRS